MAERSYPDYEPKPDDVFHAVGYTSLDILSGAQFRLVSLSAHTMGENEKLWRDLGPLAPAMESGKVVREFVEVLSFAPFLSSGEMPYQGPNDEMFLSIEYLSDSALRLCREFGIQHPPVIEKVRRADIPPGHGITLRAISYRRK